LAACGHSNQIKLHKFHLSVGVQFLQFVGVRLSVHRRQGVICVKLSFSNRSVYITCSYIPSSFEFLEYLNHLSAIQSISNKLSDRDQLVVLGDFNIPGRTWSPEEKSNILLPLAQHDFIDGLLALSLSQVNYFRNSLGRLLDLCLAGSHR